MKGLYTVWLYALPFKDIILNYLDPNENYQLNIRSAARGGFKMQFTDLLKMHNRGILILNKVNLKRAHQVIQSKYL